MKFKKEIKFLPAWDRRKEGNGIGACRVSFVLKGRHGAVTFQLGTGWYLPQNREWTTNNQFVQEFIAKPFIYDVGYHSYKPMPHMKGDEHDFVMHKCCFLEHKDCYYEGSAYSYMNDVFDVLIAEGTDGLWALLEQLYRDYFIRKEHLRWWPFKRKKEPEKQQQ